MSDAGDEPTCSPGNRSAAHNGTEPTQIAIACQGGGSHTAFTAGVLREILSHWADSDETFELVGISGTSGGAFNALAVWYGLVTGDEETAIEVVDGIWSDIAASDAFDRVLNSWLTASATLESNGFTLPKMSPYYSPGSNVGQRRIADVLEQHIDFEAIPELCAYDEPELVVGTVNIETGAFETFTNEAVTVEAVLASAALPTLFEAVEIDGESHWDGLFSQNPPVKDLMSVPGERTPDELWVIQINPQVRDGVPTSHAEIMNRRNELAGNISLNQELRFIERINEWIENGHFDHPEYTMTTIRRIELSGYDSSTKLDRDPAFIAELLARGEEQAAEFLDDRHTE